MLDAAWRSPLPILLPDIMPEAPGGRATPTKPSPEPNRGPVPFVFVKGKSGFRDRRSSIGKFDRLCATQNEPGTWLSPAARWSKVDRVEWHIVRDPFTALNWFCRAGEFDFGSSRAARRVDQRQGDEGRSRSLSSTSSEITGFFRHQTTSSPPIRSWPRAARSSAVAALVKADRLPQGDREPIPIFFRTCKSFPCLRDTLRGRSGRKRSFLAPTIRRAIKAAFCPRQVWDGLRRPIVISPADRSPCLQRRWRW